MHTQHQHTNASRNAALALLSVRSVSVPLIRATLGALDRSDYPNHLSEDEAWESLGLGGRSSRLWS